MRFAAPVIFGIVIGITGLACGQDGNLQPPAAGETAQGALADIQSKVDKIQTLTANLEFDRKDEDDKKKKKKKANKPANPNPAWPEPPGRDVERGPLAISRGAGAKVTLERKESKEVFVANSSDIWKYDVDDKEAQHIPASWPVIDKYVSNALRMNIFVAMDPETLKLKGTESINGVPCWVIEGKSPSTLGSLGADPTKMKLWISKEDGIPRLISVPSEKDTKIWLKDVKLNQPVDASQFQFTVPAGVETKNIFGF